MTPALFLDRDHDLWARPDGGQLLVWNRALGQWIPSHRTDREVELDYGPLTEIPWPGQEQRAAVPAVTLDTPDDASLHGLHDWHDVVVNVVDGSAG